MPIKKNFNNAETTPEEQLAFYGFWLWNYTTSEFFQDIAEGDDSDNWDNLNNMLKCDLCSQRSEYCIYCERYIKERRQRFVQSLFRPWFDDSYDVMSNKNRILRDSSNDIMNNAYRFIKGQISSMPIDKAYVIRGLSSSTKVLKIDKEATYDRWATIGLKSIVDIRIDMSLPLNVILSDISKLHEAFMNGWRYQSFTDEDIEELNMDHKYDYARKYRDLLRILKSFDGISFNSNNHSARALGFWLWEQIDLLQTFSTVDQAVNFLESGEKFPQDILSVFGYSGSDMTVLSRLRRLTKRCVEEGEVMAMG